MPTEGLVDVVRVADEVVEAVCERGEAKRVHDCGDAARGALEALQWVLLHHCIERLLGFAPGLLGRGHLWNVCFENVQLNGVTASLSCVSV